MSQLYSKTLLERLLNAKLVVAFTGAGMSAESGVATFRTEGGLWQKFRPEELASVDAFLANPELVWQWYGERRKVVLGAAPNAGHRAIAALEELIPQVSVVTQNVDGLHGEAGSSEVIELHGNIRKNFCQSCHRRYDEEALMNAPSVPRCECGGLVRPDVVWFGEMLPEHAFALAEKRCNPANVLFSIGTSSLVYPAAALPMRARESGAYVVEINPEQTPLTPYAHESIRAASGSVMPDIVERLREMKRSGISP